MCIFTYILVGVRFKISSSSILFTYYDVVFQLKAIFYSDSIPRRRKSKLIWFSLSNRPKFRTLICLLFCCCCRTRFTFSRPIVDLICSLMCILQPPSVKCFEMFSKESMLENSFHEFTPSLHFTFTYSERIQPFAVTIGIVIVIWFYQ